MDSPMGSSWDSEQEQSPHGVRGRSTESSLEIKI